jgi:3-deoxy-D-manno-octulosonic-acid transferase
MFMLFDILYFVGFILYLPILFLSGKWHGGFKDRFGFFTPDSLRRLASGKNIWIHAVSVGEVVAIDGLVQSLRADYPGHQLVMSVTTKTGYSLAKRKYPENILLLWAPLDFSWVVRRFVNAIKPVLYIAAETELWPNLFRRLSNDGVPIVVINGRISDNAFSRYRLMKGLLQGTVRRVRLFCMQSSVDVERVIALGADSSAVKLAGNVKFDNTPPVVSIGPRELGLDQGHLVLVGGSTHPGEEECLVGTFLSLRRQYPALRLVLAPRHPERAADISRLVKTNGLNPVFFSTNRSVIGPDDVLIVNAIGHLLGYYAAATVVFVGKSLTAKGGHNIIEPAVYGKPIIIGPHMQNFRDISEAFKKAGAVIQVKDALGLKTAVAGLLADENRRREIGQRALEVIHNNCGATRRTMDLIKTVWR